MGHGDAPDDTLSASELDALSSTMRNRDHEGIPEVHLYVDTCYAGGFLKKCSGAPEGTRRLIVAGTSDRRVGLLRLL